MRKTTNLYIETKEEIKTLAADIKDTKQGSKKAHRSGRAYPDGSRLDYSLIGKTRRFTALHLAMSLYRGRTIDEVFANGEDTDYDKALADRTLASLNAAYVRESEKKRQEAADAA